MIVRNVLAGCGILALAGISAVAVNANWDEFSDHPPRLAVSFSGLDLASSEGLDILNARIRRAIDEVCDDHGSRSLEAQRLEQVCRANAWAGVRPQLDAAIYRARDGRLGRQTEQASVVGDIARQPGGIRKSVGKALQRSFDTGITANWYSWGSKGLVYAGPRTVSAGRPCRAVTVTVKSHGEQQVLTQGTVCETAYGVLV